MIIKIKRKVPRKIRVYDCDCCGHFIEVNSAYIDKDDKGRTSWLCPECGEENIVKTFERIDD